VQGSPLCLLEQRGAKLRPSQQKPQSRRTRIRRR